MSETSMPRVDRATTSEKKGVGEIDLRLSVGEVDLRLMELGGVVDTERGRLEELLQRVGMLDNRLAAVEKAVDDMRPRRPNPRPMRERTYTVQEGDTLAKIAKRVSGQAGRYVELASFNRIPAHKELTPGAVLRLPLTWPA